MTEPGSAPGSGTIGTQPAVLTNIDQTIGPALALATRILGDRVEAGRACEAAYVAAFRHSPGSLQWDRHAELAFLGRVRSEALRLKAARTGPARSAGPADSYLEAKMVNDHLAAADPVGRSALELCYFGGLSATEAAQVLGEPVERVRSAIRALLLALGASVRQGERQQA